MYAWELSTNEPLSPCHSRRAGTTRGAGFCQKLMGESRRRGIRLNSAMAMPPNTITSQKTFLFLKRGQLQTKASRRKYRRQYSRSKASSSTTLTRRVDELAFDRLYCLRYLRRDAFVWS